ncbi:MAG: 16S rRNA (cytosine(1402)-N(4))-methyltransferase RsmH [Pseudomonadota bacterium]|nr:16S rRNA (cytosine(1402)-N(4))-methyltransferase RsmH [Pseudomonadota bacterium]
MSHKPVMIKEVIDLFCERIPPTKKFLDATFGRGGHTRALLEHIPDCKVWALDQDIEAVRFGEVEFSEYISQGRLKIIQSNFTDFEEKCEQRVFDGILLDLGVSSPQLDVATRGFSFYHEGPLDMRMDQSQGITAQDIVNGWSERDLSALFRELGEISNPDRVVRAIVSDRKKKKFTTTRELAGMVERLCGWRKKGHHPATNFFLALRLSVNGELDVIVEALPKMVRALSENGRLIVLTFHSLEDRIVKNIFKGSLELGRLINKKVIVPSRDEILSNPRSRSAKLRAFEKGHKVGDKVGQKMGESHESASTN